MMIKKQDFLLPIEEKPPLRLTWRGWSQLPELLSQLPKQPVVYIFEEEGRKPIYIGKTIHPVTRIRQHVKNALGLAGKAEHFVFKTKTLKLIPVNSELESILLEARLIRTYAPKFNLIQKDDKSELYIVISEDDYPEVKVYRGTDLPSKGFVVGPFTSGRQVDSIFKLARRIFRFCAKPPNKAKKQTGRACFYYHLGLCDGACVGKVSGPSYRKKIGLLKKFLRGRTKLVLSALKTGIKKAVKLRDFESAKKKRDMYFAIYHAAYVNQGLSSYLTAPVENKLKVLAEILKENGVIPASLERIEAYDIATLQQNDTVGSMVVLFMGAPQKSEYKKFKIKGVGGGDPAAMREMLTRRFNHPEWEKPGLVLLDGGIPQLSVAGDAIPEEIPRIGLAKKEETIIIPEKNGYKWVSLPRYSPALKLLQEIRDEAHRFATTYHKKVRDRRRIE